MREPLFQARYNTDPTYVVPPHPYLQQMVSKSVSSTAGRMRHREKQCPDYSIPGQSLAQRLFIEAQKAQTRSAQRIELGHILFIDDRHTNTPVLLPPRDNIEGTVLENKNKLRMTTFNV